MTIPLFIPMEETPPVTFPVVPPPIPAQDPLKLICTSPVVPQGAVAEEIPMYDTEADDFVKESGLAVPEEMPRKETDALEMLK